MKMRKVLLLIGLLLPSVIWSQNLDEIQLGLVKGELKQFHGALKWVNENNTAVSGAFWTDQEWLKFSENSFSVAKDDTLVINYTIDINKALGLNQAEIRLLDSQGILLHGFLIQGRFLPSDTLALDTYRNEFFPFKAKEQVFNIGLGFNNKGFSKIFTLYNFGGDSLDLRNVTSELENVVFKFSPALISHNQFTRMELIYSPGPKLQRGFIRERISLFDTKNKLIAVLPVQFTLEDDLTTNNGSAPKLTVSKLSHDFKVMSTGLIKEVSIKISNNGNADLSLLKLESNCDCLTYSLEDDVLSPGQSAELIVKFNADQRMGYERKTLAIFSNDPNESTKVLIFKAHVK
jgi:uncharacterized protein DUF1573